MRIMKQLKVFGDVKNKFSNKREQPVAGRLM